jgi:N-acetylmuramoyl-L-alanine amidase
MTVFRPRTSPNFGSRNKSIQIDMLLIHYTGLPSTEVSLKRMCDPKMEVSAHYLIDEKGFIYQLVAEKDRAWHAGVSYWAGETDTNSRSIGIELQNPGHEWGYTPFPNLQMGALRELSQDILARYQISNRLVLGHSDVAPARKKDPGHLFDWEWLAKSGVGYWPETSPVTSSVDSITIRNSLNNIGYDPKAKIVDVITAIQRHYRPKRIDGKIDADCISIINALENDTP